MSEAPSSRRGGPGGGKPKKQVERYQLMHKSIEDPTYEGAGTSTVLQPLDGTQRDPMAALMNYEEKFEMQMYEDEEPDPELFGDDVWECNFDQDWIREMNKPDEDDQEVLDLQEFDFSAQRGGKKTDEDRLLERALGDYAADADMDKDDPRVHGPESNVNMYKPALQEFLDDTRKVDFLGADPTMKDMDYFEPSPNEINPAVPKGLGDAVYHTKDGGVFLAVNPSQRSRNIAIDYRTGLRESNRAVKERIQENPDGALASDVDSDELFEEEEEKGPQYDAQTILSTYSNLENRPGVIERLHGLQGLTTKKRKYKKRPQAGEEEEEGEPEELDADVADRLTALTATATSGRPKEETTDEKRERKRLVKEGRLLKRQQKKGLKVAFRDEETKQRITGTNTERQKRTVPLGAR